MCIPIKKQLWSQWGPPIIDVEIPCIKKIFLLMGGGEQRYASPIRPLEPFRLLICFNCILTCKFFFSDSEDDNFLLPSKIPGRKGQSLSTPRKQRTTEKILNSPFDKSGSTKKTGPSQSCAELYPMEEVSMYPSKSSYE